MHYDFGSLSQIRYKFKERGVRLLLDLLAQQSQSLVIEGGRVASTVRFRGQAIAFTIAVEQTRDRAAVNLKG